MNAKRWILALGLAAAATHAAAVNCTASAGGVSFGAYNPFSAVALNGTGNIAVTCDVSAPYMLALSTGGGSYASRTMLSGTHPLSYNLYTDATRTAVWGDGAGGTSTVSGSGTSANHTVYGRISARQNAYVGSYGDTITVTVTF